MDGRRRQWLPLYSKVAFSRTGTALNERWGMEGLCTWMLFLAACKREPLEGTFSYTSEPDAWAKLGAQATLFTLDEFFALTGRLRQTRRTASGRITNVVCTRWGDWNYAVQTEFDRQKKSRKRARNTGDNGRDVQGTDRDSDKDNDKDSLEGRVSGLLTDLGPVSPERIERLIAAYPDKDHYGEAVAMVDWTLSKGIERKDVAGAYRKWLQKAPKIEREVPYPRSSEPV